MTFVNEHMLTCYVDGIVGEALRRERARRGYGDHVKAPHDQSAVDSSLQAISLLLGPPNDNDILRRFLHFLSDEGSGSRQEVQLV